MQTAQVSVVGAGLAGCEAAWQAARRGLRVALYEMKPLRFSPAHAAPDFAELVCSNSLRSNLLGNAVGLLKEEMRRLDSLILAAADESAVPAGKALAVDRVAFARRITETLESHPRIEIRRACVEAIPPERPLILASACSASSTSTSTTRSRPSSTPTRSTPRSRSGRRATRTAKATTSTCRSTATSTSASSTR